MTSLTDSGVVEHGGQDKQDMVGPVLPVVGHLKVLDHQDVQVSGALHGVIDVEQAVLLAPRRWRENGALQKVGVLETKMKDHRSVTMITSCML